MEVDSTISVATTQAASSFKYSVGNGSGNGGSAQTVAVSVSNVEVEGGAVQTAAASESGGGRDDKPKLEMPGTDTLKRAIDDVNKAIEGANRRLDVRIHERTGHIMIKIVDDETGDTVREIPPEKSLDFLAKVLEKAGVLVDAKG